MCLFRGSVQKEVEESEGHIFKGQDGEEEWVSSRVREKWKNSAGLSFLDPFFSPQETNRNIERGDEENQAAGYDHPEDQGETEPAAAGQYETGGVLTSEATQQGIDVVFLWWKVYINLSLTGVKCNVCNVVLIFNVVMTEPTGSFDGSEPGSPLPEPASPVGPSTSTAVPTGVYRQ